jgi:hypothetical protein
LTAQDIVDSVVGQLCWQAQRGHGSFLTFEFGERVAGPGRDHGEWHLWVYFGDWTLSGPDGVLATDTDDKDIIDRAVARFGDKRLVSARVDPVSMEALFDFEGGLRLEIGPNSGEEEANAEWWLLFTPQDRVLAVGPGPAWRYDSSNEPRSVEGLPRP